MDRKTQIYADPKFDTFTIQNLVKAHADMIVELWDIHGVGGVEERKSFRTKALAVSACTELWRKIEQVNKEKSTMAKSSAAKKEATPETVDMSKEPAPPAEIHATEKVYTDEELAALNKTDETDVRPRFLAEKTEAPAPVVVDSISEFIAFAKASIKTAMTDLGAAQAAIFEAELSYGEYSDLKSKAEAINGQIQKAFAHYGQVMTGAAQASLTAKTAITSVYSTMISAAKGSIQQPKTAKTPKATGAPKTAGDGRRGAAPKYGDNCQIIKLVEGNPKREGSKERALFAYYEGNPTVGEFIAKVGDAGKARAQFMYDITRNLVRVDQPTA